MKFVLLLVLAVIAWRLFFKRWPWQPGWKTPQSRDVENARELLGVDSGASRQDIIDAHRRRMAVIHPDRGGRNEDVHQANAARDILLGQRTITNQEQI